ncbi:hypothetical protein [Thorsellia anophelis]|uniref:Uncharacterized protein n=1 Tax=Thorsellia anophelis DSM 18579 TaxID=1123402 RepID=A0A1I0EFL5_9GAMM|nr:hypothetical protein [Thorsellia anophelis]SET43241.1 hypothetical protein SAMN02583745_02344 [Thorsellia anophelis DSM 18579]
MIINTKKDTANTSQENLKIQPRSFILLLISQLTIFSCLFGIIFFYSIQRFFETDNNQLEEVYLLIPIWFLFVFAIIYGLQWACLRSENFKNQRKVSKFLTIIIITLIINIFTAIDILYYGNSIFDQFVW